MGLTFELSDLDPPNKPKFKLSHSSSHLLEIPLDPE